MSIHRQTYSYFSMGGNVFGENDLSPCSKVYGCIMTVNELRTRRKEAIKNSNIQYKTTAT